jgi:hypothetical protein
MGTGGIILLRNHIYFLVKGCSIQCCTFFFTHKQFTFWILDLYLLLYENIAKVGGKTF